VSPADPGIGNAHFERYREENLSPLAHQLQTVYHRSFESAAHSPASQEEATLLPTLELHARRDGFDLIGAWG
jgi:hypothetical protein